MSELRERVGGVVFAFMHDEFAGTSCDCIDRIAELLEDTGAPAYMRVAADLRGERDDA